MDQHLSFNNNQTFSTVDPQTTRHVTRQSGRVSGSSTSIDGHSTGRTFQRTFSYSLTSDVLRHSNPNRSRTHTVHLHQVYDQHIEQREGGLPPYTAAIHNERTAADQVNFNFNAGRVGLSGNRDQTSTQAFSFTDSLGDCYKAELKADGGKVTSFTEGKGCTGKPMRWFVHPTGSPDSFGWRKYAAH